jgi:hypothetical protein
MVHEGAINEMREPGSLRGNNKFRQSTLCRDQPAKKSACHNVIIHFDIPIGFLFLESQEPGVHFTKTEGENYKLPSVDVSIYG